MKCHVCSPVSPLTGAQAQLSDSNTFVSGAVQGWVPEKQREFLHDLPGSIATDATLQLLLQSSHKWIYTPPSPAAGPQPNLQEKDICSYPSQNPYSLN